jgi:hypothetical protein
VCLLASELRDIFCSYSVFKSLFVIGGYPVNMNILASKRGVLYIGFKKQNDCLLRNDSNDFYQT